MAETLFTNAKFWKCALQVNPAGYIEYRGKDHGLTEEQYNQTLLNTALENDIKVVGLADHGNVDGVDAIRNLLNTHQIIVFPGFEIATTEKAHFVCLFPEDTTKDQLNRYLGALGLTNPANGVWPSNLGGNELLSKVEELKGFVYAAHCTDDSGILRQKLVHVWQNPLLKAAQIPGDLDELKTENGNGYRHILINKNPDYVRDLTIGIINAKDVAMPEDLANPKASCLIKMTNPSFESFKLAFQDPESRVRLNSDISEKYYSRIERFTVTGGYLDEIRIDFSEHLNSVIGGRGTGKSTLIECIRYSLGLDPIGKNAKKQHDEIIKENLGKSKARVELVIRSSKMNGKRFIVARRFGESISVKDEDGTPSSFTPTDLLPDIEVYGQNEIYEIAQDGSNQRKLLSRFLDAGQQKEEANIKDALTKLATNRQSLIDNQSSISEIEDEVSRLPKLEEQLEQFKNLGIEEKLKIIPLLESEKTLLTKINDETDGLNQVFQSIEENLPDDEFLNEDALENLPHAELFRSIREMLANLSSEAKALLKQWNEKYIASSERMKDVSQKIQKGIQNEDNEPPRVLRRLQHLREWSYEQVKQVFT